MRGKCNFCTHLITRACSQSHQVHYNREFLKCRDNKTIGYFFPNTVTGSGTEPVLFWIVSLQEGMERGNKEMRRGWCTIHTTNLHTHHAAPRSLIGHHIRFDWGNTGSTLSKGVRGKNQATEGNYNVVYLHNKL